MSFSSLIHSVLLPCWWCYKGIPYALRGYRVSYITLYILCIYPVILNYSLRSVFSLSSVGGRVSGDVSAIRVVFMRGGWAKKAGEH